MGEINLSAVIVSKRNEKGITQDELASFIGVSKASVSKWETGQNYPDITLLPKLASYFGISLDELLSYEAQMSNENISKLYVELSNDFSNRPFEEVMNRCCEIIKSYYSCYPLLYKLGLLIVNYGGVSADSAHKISALMEAKALFIRVKGKSKDIELKQLALHKEAICELMLGNSCEVIELLKDIKPPPHHKMLLAQAYIMTGETADAKMELQESMILRLMELFETIPPYLLICANNMERYDEIYYRATTLINAFNVKKIAPWSIIPFYLTSAQGYAVSGNIDKALDTLEEYTTLVTGDIYPLKMVKTDEFFDLIDNVAENFSFGAADMPRDEKAIKQSIASEVIDTPAFSALNANPRFIAICERLRKNVNTK